MEFERRRAAILGQFRHAILEFPALPETIRPVGAPIRRRRLGVTFRIGSGLRRRLPGDEAAGLEFEQEAAGRVGRDFHVARRGLGLQGGAIGAGLAGDFMSALN